MTVSSDVLAAVEYRSATAPEARFVTAVGDGPARTVTNREMAERVTCFAQQLERSGFRAGDACVLHTGNTVGFIVALLAVMRLGGVAVPSITASTVRELEYVIDHSGARILITTPEYAEVTKNAAADGGCVVHEESTLPLAGRPSEQPIELGSAEASCPAGTGVLMYTSGTSGRPKGVLLSRDALDYTSMSFAEHLRLRPDDTVLTCMPLFHINGMVFQLLASIVSGAGTVLTPKFSVSSYWGWVNDHGVTVGHLINGPIRMLLEQPEGQSQTSMRLMSFGLPLRDEEMTAFEKRFGLQLIMIYGQTETSCGATLTGLDQRRRSEYQNVGIPLRGWRVKAVDEDGRSVAPGAVGELLITSEGVMTGYHRDPEATKKTLRNGWVATGDLGFLDDRGDVHFVSRLKDMLKPSGENVAAVEVQEVLEDHPEIEEAAIFGVPDEMRGERIIAVVVAAPGTSPSVDRLREHCVEQLAKFKVPSEIVLVGEIPKTSVGKQRIGDLRNRFQSGALN